MRLRDLGFTLIELVVVIVILGILAATALPKFVDMRADANRAKVAALAGGFQSAVALGNAALVVKASGGYATSGMADVPGYGDGTVDFNTFGFPVDTSYGPSSGPPVIGGNSACVNLWNAILLSPPSVGTAAAGTEWQAQAGIFPAQTCTYAYLADTATSRTIFYDATTGAVTMTNP